MFLWALSVLCFSLFLYIVVWHSVLFCHVVHVCVMLRVSMHTCTMLIIIVFMSVNVYVCVTCYGVARGARRLQSTSSWCLVGNSLCNRLAERLHSDDRHYGCDHML